MIADVDKLLAAAEDTARTATFFWKAGEREMAMAVVRDYFVTREGWPEELITRFVEALARLSHDLLSAFYEVESKRD